MHAGPAGWQVAVQGQMEGCTYTDGCVMWGIECVRAKKAPGLLSHTLHPTLPRSRVRRSPSLGRLPLASHELLIDLHLSSMDEVDEVFLVGRPKHSIRRRLGRVAWSWTCSWL